MNSNQLTLLWFDILPLHRGIKPEEDRHHVYRSGGSHRQVRPVTLETKNKALETIGDEEINFNLKHKKLCHMVINCPLKRNSIIRKNKGDCYKKYGNCYKCGNC